MDTQQKGSPTGCFTARDMATSAVQQVVSKRVQPVTSCTNSGQIVLIVARDDVGMEAQEPQSACN